MWHILPRFFFSKLMGYPWPVLYMFLFRLAADVHNIWPRAFMVTKEFQQSWLGIPQIFAGLGINRTHLKRTPKKTWVSHSSQCNLGVRWDSVPLDFLMEIPFIFFLGRVFVLVFLQRKKSFHETFMDRTSLRCSPWTQDLRSNFVQKQKHTQQKQVKWASFVRESAKQVPL